MVPIIAAMMGLFVFFGVMVIDLGLMWDTRRRAQTAADFAALAAAQDLPRNPSQPDAAARLLTAHATAHDYLAGNGFDEADTDVTHAIATTFDGEVDKIEVVVTRDRQWILGGVLGLAPVTVQGRAVAQTNALPRDVGVVLDRSGSMCLFTHGGPMNDCGDEGTAATILVPPQNPLANTGVQTADGDMVVTAAVSGSSGTYTAQNGFTLGNQQIGGSTATLGTAYKAASGAFETPSMQHSNHNRQTLAAALLKAVAPGGPGTTVDLLGGWGTGLSHVAPAGSSRMLVFMPAAEDNDNSCCREMVSVSYGGQPLTKLNASTAHSSSVGARVEIWTLDEAGIAAAGSSSFSVTWDSSIDVPMYAHAFFDDVAQVVPGGDQPPWEPFNTMRAAVDQFTTYFKPIVDGQPFDHMALSSFAKYATLDQSLTTSFGPGSAFETAIAGMQPDINTNVGYGIQLARDEIVNNGNPLAFRVLIIVTDGRANHCPDGSGGFEGCPAADAEQYARDEATLAAQAGFALYTIGLTDNPGEALMQQIADIGATQGGGGQFFDVDDPDDLADVFEQIADLLNVALLE
ncbi:MAG: VWA domain-containing protein [Chloroflexi bacterium]|nr:VWA domain-containing protein [Chloroflexota bacterium]